MSLSQGASRWKSYLKIESLLWFLSSLLFTQTKVERVPRNKRIRWVLPIKMEGPGASIS